MSEELSVQWFPGHMAKTRRLIKSNLKLVDAVVEITDARIPSASRNPEMDSLTAGKPRMILLNKCDMADSAVTAKWIEHYSRSGVFALAVDCKSGQGLNKFLPTLKTMLKDRLDMLKSKGMSGRMIRIMVVGIPNAGKSSFINRLSRAARAKVEDRPGVTRGAQWVTIDKSAELLDMPGVLWPKFEDKRVGELLAFTGAVKDNVTDKEYLACRLLQFFKANYPERLCERYKISLDDITTDDMIMSDALEGYEILSRIGKARGFLISGGEIDTERAAITVTDEFRAGKLGRVSFERP